MKIWLVQSYSCWQARSQKKIWGWARNQVARVLHFSPCTRFIPDIHTCIQYPLCLTYVLKKNDVSTYLYPYRVRYRIKFQMIIYFITNQISNFKSQITQHPLKHHIKFASKSTKINFYTTQSHSHILQLLLLLTTIKLHSTKNHK